MLIKIGEYPHYGHRIYSAAAKAGNELWRSRSSESAWERNAFNEELFDFVYIPYGMENLGDQYAIQQNTTPASAV